MNRSKLNAYAPLARREFIQAVTDRAAFYGLTPEKVEPITEKGDVAIIGGKAFPREVARKRRLLEERVGRQGFEQTMEAMAYTWFNRLVAIRYMELHGYLDHGYRVLSHPEGKPTPEILEHAEHVDLPGLDRTKVIDLKLDSTREPELYRMLLIAQCNALHAAMPFLFERIDDETELLLPDNLLHSDSLIRKLVREIDEEDWQEVEVIGWLYQFYISEKKDQVIGKVVKSEDIPAATQLFTPNWIVKYLVQNSLGRQWMATYPTSPLRQKMEYYIEPAEQTPEVQAQLQAITPESLNPEEMTLLDPACGSGHILVEAYDLFRAIYQERGYRANDIPKLILQKNLFGLEIDDRAAQLSAFALMMKARADDRRIFSSGVQPRVLSIQESKGLDAKSLTEAINAPVMPQERIRSTELEFMDEIKTPLLARKNLAVKGEIDRGDIQDLLVLFREAKTFGSLIRIPEDMANRLPGIAERTQSVIIHGDLMTRKAAEALLPFVEQAQMLATKYNAVVANPPYMGTKQMGAVLKAYGQEHYPGAKADTFAMFIEQALHLVEEKGFAGLVTMQSWMFLGSYETLRRRVVTQHRVVTMAHLGPHAFDSIPGEIVQVSAFVLQSQVSGLSSGVFLRLVAGTCEDDKEQLLRRALSNAKDHLCFHATRSDFEAIPSEPIAYWLSPQFRAVFRSGRSLKDIANPTGGMTTGNNEQFLRVWHEVSRDKIGFGFGDRTSAQRSGLRWFPYNKGGEFRKWFGNAIFVVNWQNDGQEILATGRAYPRSRDYYFQPSITYSATGSYFGVRHTDKGFLFDAKGASCFASNEDHYWVLGFLSTRLTGFCLGAFNPTVEFQTGDLSKLPIVSAVLDKSFQDNVTSLSKDCISLARADWDNFETSWNFRDLAMLRAGIKGAILEQSWEAWEAHCRQAIARMQALETENNRLFIEAYGLQDELKFEVSEEEITLARPDRREDVAAFLSYAVGCMMGRYSLDKPGLIYAHSGNQGFDPSQYKTFPADPDGIIPITDVDWFEDDAANRVAEFIGVAWPREHLEENLKFITDSLGPNRDEQPRDTIRGYLAQSFFKDHLKTYKRRPIYWLFSSGKQRAFQCLVYLHRYHEGTLSRMRTEYVIPLQGKMAARIDHLDDDSKRATSTSHRRRLEKERDALIRQRAELQAFDEKLRHYADLRVSLDLDDGVKVNYGKFGDLLAEVKTVTGGSEE